jgi:hypothetical protein
MFFQKNLPMWERVLRTLAGLIVIYAAWTLPMEPLLKWGLVACGGSFIAMGFVGFCPMCALAGRKLRQ